MRCLTHPLLDCEYRDCEHVCHIAALQNLQRKGHTDTGAIISPDHKYRYLLWREWRGYGSNEHYSRHTDDNGPSWKAPQSLLFVMLNPSTASGIINDPTIRRCVGFAKDLKFDRLEVVNLFAYRATDPRELLKLLDADDPEGPENVKAVKDAAYGAGMILCAWGAYGGFRNQDQTVLGWLQESGKPLHVLGFTKKGGQPLHPLYVPTNTKLQLWEP